MARLTLNGMYDYDPTLFEGMILPEDYDRDALLFEIIQRSGQLYPYHQQPAMLKTAIRLWFARNFLNFDRTMEALMSEYDPIENYNRYEDWTRTPDLSDTNTHTGQDSTAHSGNDSLVHTGQDTVADTGKDTTTHSGKDTTKNSGTDSDLHTFTNYKETVTEAGGKTTEEQVSAFDSGTYQASKKTIETYGDPSTRTTEKAITGSNTDALTHGKQEELTHGHKEELEHGHTETTTRGTTDTQNYSSSEATTYGSTFTERHTGNEKYTAHLHGNIGVTTTQQMIEQEIELRKYDVYNDIAMRFEHEFLVQVY